MNPLDDLIGAIDGPIALTECTQRNGDCGLAADCELKQNWSFVNHMVADLFHNISLAQMAGTVAGHSQDPHREPVQTFTFRP